MMSASAQVVLLHGVGLDPTMWDGVRAELPLGLRVHAPALVGHRGAPPAPPNMTLTDLAEHVLHTLPERAHLVGFSLGAMVGQYMARFHPTRVASLVCLSSVHRRSADQRRAVINRLHRAEQDFEGGVEAAVDRWFPPGRRVDSTLVEHTRAVLLANDRTSYLRCYRVFATADQDLAAELPFIQGPVAAVTGELDTGSTPEMSHRIAGAVPDGRSAVVPGVGHMLPVERPRETAVLISQFIKEHEYAH